VDGGGVCEANGALDDIAPFEKEICDLDSIPMSE
jgi:hypothetical protein